MIATLQTFSLVFSLLIAVCRFLMAVLIFVETALKLISSRGVCWTLHTLLTSLSAASSPGIPQWAGIHCRTIVFLFSAKLKCMDLRCCVETVSEAWQQLAIERIAGLRNRKNYSLLKDEWLSI